MAKGTRPTREIAPADQSNNILPVDKTEITGEFKKRDDLNIDHKPVDFNDPFSPEQVKDLQQPALETVVNIAKEKANATDKGIKPDELQKETMPIPTPGRFVTFFPHTSDQLHGSGKSWPALVTEADKDGNLSLQVFGKYTIGPRFTIPHKDNKQKGSELGHWEWPARS